MKRFSLAICLLGLVLAGCNASTPAGGSAGAGSSGPALGQEDLLNNVPVDEPAAAAAEPAGNEVALTPENTRIQFVCAHVGDKPDPRTGNFEKFDGKAVVDGGTLKSIRVDIETASINAEVGEKLTNHLKSPDFFDVREHPKATFVSTAIEPAGEGQVTITGDLTLLKVTKPITFPATVSTENGLTLQAEFSFDRTEFGMTYSPDRVEKTVAMTVTIGN